MDEISDSSSLEIVEPEKQIMFSSGSDLHENSDLSKEELDYSKDEASLSFAIQQDNKSSMPIEPTPISNQPPKRKRRQIFQKYKFTKRKQESQAEEVKNGEDEILKTFDEIFKINTPRNQNSLSSPTTGFNSKHTQPLPATKAFIKKQKYVGHEQPNVLELNENNMVIKTDKNEENKQEDNIANSSSFFQTPLDEFNKNKSLHLSNIENRFSLIENNISIDASKDSEDIANILSTKIFEQNEKPSEGLQQIQEHNLQENMDHTKSTVVYQKIDLSSSVSPSIMMKDSRFTMRDYNQPNNLLGAAEGRGFSNQKRAKTMGNLFSEDQQIQQQQINMKFQKIKGSACEQSRVSILLRNLNKLNQIYPNFENISFKKKLIEEENKHLQFLIMSCKQTLDVLESIIQQLSLFQQQKKKLSSLLHEGITVSQFLCLNWLHLEIPKNSFLIRPQERFIQRKWNRQKSLKALENYKAMTSCYLGRKINLGDSRGVSKYFDIRNRFWIIQANLRLISEDIYSHVLTHQIPIHYFQFHQILSGNQTKYSPKWTGDLADKTRLLVENNDTLAVSEVGSAVMKKLKRYKKLYGAF